MARILLGVTGSIAAYKACELVRRLREQGHEVQVVMTRAACEFVSPLTFASLSGKPVLRDLWDPVEGVRHVAAADEAELLLVAPATADVIGKMALGLADDFLTTAALAFAGPIVVAPAMDDNMWKHPAVAANVHTLEKRGVTVVPPAKGPLASGHVGEGRLAEVPDVLAAVARALPQQRKK
ncbi:MAG: phosphopantothenoylcysteine decarboxylase [Planctomycetales bacterium]|nr:phosphopantothenoylcysteine decarboxylase [Planctomycetales bacterium]